MEHRDLGEERSALEFVQIGLERDPANEYCLKLRMKLAGKKFGSA